MSDRWQDEFPGRFDIDWGSANAAVEAYRRWLTARIIAEVPDIISDITQGAIDPQHAKAYRLREAILALLAGSGVEETPDA